MAGTDVIYAEKSFPYEVSSFGKLKNGAGSVKSTKSLYFTDPDASGTMARDEEVTVNIYDIYSDGPSDHVEEGGKIKRSEIAASVVTNGSPFGGLTNGDISKSPRKARTPPATPPKIKKMGSFQMKAVEITDGIAGMGSSSSFQTQHSAGVASSVSLSSSLAADQSSSSPDVVSTTTNLATVDQVQKREAVPNRKAINQDIKDSRIAVDLGSETDVSGGDAMVDTVAHRTSNVEITRSTERTGRMHYSPGQNDSKQSIVSEISSVVSTARSERDLDRSDPDQIKIIHESAKAKPKDDNKIGVKSGTKGKFVIRYKEGSDPGKGDKFTDRKEEKLEIGTKTQRSEDYDEVSVKSSSTVKSVVKDEKIRDAIGGLIAGGRTPDVSTSAPSSLLRQKKLQVHATEIDIDNQYSVESGKDEGEFGSSTFPRDKSTNKDKSIVSSMPTSPYEEMKGVVEGGTVGKLVKDLFWNMPLTGRAIDPSTIERIKSPVTDSEAIQQESTQQKYQFLVEGIDTPQRPSDDVENSLDVEQTTRDSSQSIDDADIKSEPQSPSTPDVRSSLQEIAETPMKSDESLHVYTEEVSSLKRLEKKGFSYIDRKLAQDVVKKADDFTARRRHESLEARISDHQQEAARKSQRESLILAEAKARLQKKEPMRDDQVKDLSTSEESAALIEAKSKLHKHIDKNAMQSSEDGSSQKIVIRSSMLLAAKMKLNKTNRPDQSDNDVNDEANVNTVTHGNKRVEDRERDVTAHIQSADRSTKVVTSRTITEYTRASSDIKTKQTKQSTLVTETNDKEQPSATTAKKIDGHGSMAGEHNRSDQVTEINNNKTVTPDTRRTSKDLSRQNYRSDDEYLLDSQIKETAQERNSGVDRVNKYASSPSVVSPAATEPPDSAYFSDGKVSPKNKIKNIVDDLPKPEQRDAQEITVGFAATEGLHTMPDTVQGRTEESHSEKILNVMNEATQNENTSTGFTRYDRTEPSEVQVTATSKAEQNKEQKTSSVNGTAFDNEVRPINSLRELKKLSNNQQAGNAPISESADLASESDLIEIAVSSPKEVPTITTETDNTALNKREGATDTRQESATVAGKYTEKDGQQEDEKELAPSSSSGSYTAEQSAGESHIYTEIKVRRISSEEMRKEFRLLDGAGNRVTISNQFSDSGSETSCVSSGMVGAVGRRDLQLGIDTGYSGRAEAVYSPGQSSSQTDNTSISVPIISPGASRTSSVSTTAQDTFEYSHVRRRPDERRRGALRNAADHRKPPQPLTINIGSAPEASGEKKSKRPLGLSGRSAARGPPAYQRVYADSGAPSTVNADQRVLSTSRSAAAELNRRGAGRRRHSASRRAARQFYKPTAFHAVQPSGVRHPTYRMRPRDESFNSQSTGPLSPPGRYLRVDESRGGRLPVYGSRSMTIRDVEGFEYNAVVGNGSSQRRHQHGQFVSQVHVDDYDDRFDGNSAVSEPIYPTSSGKYSVQRVMEKRGLVAAQPPHPDMQHQSRKRRVYQISGSTTDGRVQTLNHVAPRVRSPEVTAVDPSLQEADKKGDRYNISIKLNAVGSRPVSRNEELYEQQVNSTNSHVAARYESNQENTLYTYRGANRSNSYREYDDRELASTDSTLRQMTLVKLKDLPHGDDNMQGQYTTKARFRVKHELPQLVVQGQSVSSEGDYLVSSMVGTNGQTVSGAAVSPAGALSPTAGSEAPRFTMTVNQTMTMNYAAPTDEETDEAAGRAASRKTKASREWHREAERSEDVLQTAGTSDGERKHRKRAHRKMNGHAVDDLEAYLSPAEEDKDGDQHVGQIPHVLRGSILIKNAIDTTGAPKVIDIVEGDDSDEEFVVEDNVNMFQRSYFQSRENPLYASDQDLSETKEKQYKPPEFTNIFDADNERYTEIKVTREGDRRHKKSKERSRKTGYDEPDVGYNDQWDETRRTKMSREQRTQYEISRLLKDAPQGSIKQSINVEREEEDIIGPLPAQHADGSGAKPEDMLNFDTVSEKVDLGLRDGKAEVTVKVRCERIVPIRGVEDMFKKSSVIVTRLIEIDLLATEERRRLWENIVRRTSQAAITDSKDRRQRRHQQQQAAHDAKLSTKDTFNLYKTFMGLAEADDAGQSTAYTRIDRQVDEERRPELYAATDGNLFDGDDQLDAPDFDPEELDRKVEENLSSNYTSRKIEPDTMSYMSAASETRDMLY